MIEPDTVKLLRECDAGIKMGTDAIDDVLGHVKNEQMKSELNDCRRAHEELKLDCKQFLHRYEDEGKAPNVLAEGMSKLKTNVKLMADPTDETVAELMIDGCHMGIKSLSRYLNQYQAADEQSKDIAKRLVALEDQLARQMRAYL